MNILRISASTLLSLWLVAFAGAAEPARPHCGVGLFGLCGYVDAAGAEVIVARFEQARPFSNGLAAVRLDGVWGFIDPSGAVVIKPRFEAVSDFYGARAEAVTGGRAGIINRDGNFVIPPQFSRALPFTDDVALISERGSSQADLAAAGFDTALLVGSYRLYHRRDGWLTSTPQKFSWFHGPEDGEASLIWASDTSKLNGLLNDRGEWVIQPRYAFVQRLRDGLAIVRAPHRDDGWGAVDESGQLMIPLAYHWLGAFNNGYAVVGGPGRYDTRKQGIIRSDGKVLAEPLYEEARLPENGGLPQVKSGGIWYEIAASGELTLAQEPDGTVIASCPQGLRVKRQGAGYLIEDATGWPALPQPVDHVSFGIRNDDGSMDGAQSFSKNLDCRTPIIVSIGDVRNDTFRSTYIAQDGRPLFDPPRFFASAYHFHFSHAAVGTAQLGKTGDWGIIDENGQFTRPLGPGPIAPGGPISKLVNAAIFISGNGERARLINAKGQAVPEIDKVVDTAKRQQALRCKDGARIIGDGERFGIADAGDNIVIPAIHRAISCFDGGVAWVPREGRNDWCPIGPSGEFRDEPLCIEAFYPIQLSHAYPERMAEHPHENSVLWVRAALRYGMGLRENPPGWRGDGVMNRADYFVFPFDLR